MPKFSVRAMAAKKRKFLVEFIRMYESLPCLWKIKGGDYHNRLKKDAAYIKLVRKLKEFIPNADRAIVTQKINTIRSNYRRELRKVKDSIKAGDEEVYRPTLWYFDNLKFLQAAGGGGGEIDGSHTIIEETIDESTMFSDMEYVDMTHEFSECEEDTKPNHVEKINNHSVREKTEMILSPTPTLPVHPMTSTKKSSLMEDSEIFGKCWAAEYRKLEPEQQLFAKRTIDEVLFQARLGRLNEDSCKIPTDIQ